MIKRPSSSSKRTVSPQKCKVCLKYLRVIMPMLVFNWTSATQPPRRTPLLIKWWPKKKYRADILYINQKNRHSTHQHKIKQSMEKLLDGPNYSRSSFAQLFRFNLFTWVAVSPKMRSHFNRLTAIVPLTYVFAINQNRDISSVAQSNLSKTDGAYSCSARICTTQSP